MYNKVPKWYDNYNATEKLLATQYLYICHTYLTLVDFNVEWILVNEVNLIDLIICK